MKRLRLDQPRRLAAGSSICPAGYPFRVFRLGPRDTPSLDACWYVAPTVRFSRRAITVAFVWLATVMQASPSTHFVSSVSEHFASEYSPSCSFDGQSVHSDAAIFV